MPIGARESKSRAMLDNSRRRGFGAIAFALVAITLGCEANLRPEVPDAQPAVRIPEPVGVVEGEASRNLLQGYADRDPDVAGSRWACPDARPLCKKKKRTEVPVTWEEESRSWKLPYQAKRIAAALMIATAHDRLESLRFIFTPEAQWGLPYAQRPGARPIFDGDEGEAFFRTLRKVGARLPEKTDWNSHPVPTGVLMLLSTGAEPMWTQFVEGPDEILMRLVVYKGAARIDYVGLYDELPKDRPPADAYGPPPPLVPPLRPSIKPAGLEMRPGAPMPQ